MDRRTTDRGLPSRGQWSAALFIDALRRAVSQLADRDIIKAIIGALLITIAVMVALGWLAWHGAYWAIGRWPVLAGAEATGLVLMLILLVLGWLLFRTVAMMVMGLFSDSVAAAVERKYYPQAAQLASDPPLLTSLRLGLSSLGRAMLYNILAAPLYIVLLVTGVGTLIALILVNGLAIGKDLEAMMAARFPRGALEPLPRRARYMLGVLVAALFSVPFVNLIAPVIGTAMAVHVLHARNGQLPNAPLRG